MIKPNFGRIKISAGDVSTYLILLLSPIYIFQQNLIYLGVLGNTLSALFSAAAILCSTILFLYYVRDAKKRLNITSALFWLSIFYTLIIACLEYAFSPTNGYKYSMLAWSLRNLAFVVIFYLAGSYLELSKLIRPLFIMSLFAYLLLFNNIDSSGIYAIGSAGAESGITATYQGIGRSFLLFILIFSSLGTSNKYIELFSIVFGTIALYLIGSRTDFALYVITIYIMYGSYAAISTRRFLKFIAISFISVMTASQLLFLLPNNRMLQLFDIAASTSFLGRVEYNDFAIEQIAKNPILGNYGSYIYFGGIGYYPHNIISAWLNLGIVGFILYISIFIVLWFKAIGQIKSSHRLEEFRVFYSFMIFVTLAVLISKTYNYMLIGFAIGLYENYNNSLQKPIRGQIHLKGN